MDRGREGGREGGEVRERGKQREKERDSGIVQLKASNVWRGGVYASIMWLCLARSPNPP